jgi:threonine dehydrogenase-like Zn-dependent dehydrogenase
VFVDCSGGAALDVALSVLRPNGYVMLVGAVGDVCSSFSCLPLLASKGAIIKVGNCPYCTYCSKRLFCAL